MKKLFACALIVCSMTGAAAAQDAGTVAYVSGNDLAEVCRSYLTVIRENWKSTNPQLVYNAGRCTGFVTGALDALAMEGVQKPHAAIVPRACPPKTLAMGAATEIVANFLDRQPQYRSEPGFFAVRRAIAAAYPCP